MVKQLVEVRWLLLEQLIEALSLPPAYAHEIGTVKVHHTHISVVFLAGPYAYKIKKPVNLGFLDFSTLEKRRHFCEEEVRLNRRLAADVYLGVVPVLRAGDEIRMEGAGDVVEWAVKMKRLPEEATLLSWFEGGRVDVATIEKLAARVADFHAHAADGSPIAAFGRFEVVAENARENFRQAKPQVGITISPEVFERLRILTEQRLVDLKPIIDRRAERGVPKDTHGDLHLDHVYLFPDQPPPADIVIVDCIEFNDRFRFADPIADMAFLVMDMIFHGRRDLAKVFIDTYVRISGDSEGRALVPFYTAYRAAVRGKVEGFELGESEVPDAERVAALHRARGHWLLALGQLERADRRPCLVLLGGLPGTGKSTLSHSLARQAGFEIIRSDALRKELAGLAADAPAPASFEDGIYSPQWSWKTHQEALARADRLLFEGKRVIVDASFREESHRRAFIDAAQHLKVPVGFLICEASPETVKKRLAQRSGDASDADWQIYCEAAKRWQPPADSTKAVSHIIATENSDDAVRQALAILDQAELAR